MIGTGGGGVGWDPSGPLPAANLAEWLRRKAFGSRHKAGVALGGWLVPRARASSLSASPFAVPARLNDVVFSWIAHLARMNNPLLPLQMTCFKGGMCFSAELNCVARLRSSPQR